jgi:hypothetical protein
MDHSNVLAEIFTALVDAADAKVRTKTIARHGRVDPLSSDELDKWSLSAAVSSSLLHVFTERKEPLTWARWRTRSGPIGRCPPGS